MVSTVTAHRASRGRRARHTRVRTGTRPNHHEHDRQHVEAEVLVEMETEIGVEPEEHRRNTFEDSRSRMDRSFRWRTGTRE